MTKLERRNLQKALYFIGKAHMLVARGVVSADGRILDAGRAAKVGVLYGAHEGDGPCAADTPGGDDWAQREAEARALLGEDYEAAQDASVVQLDCAMSPKRRRRAGRPAASTTEARVRIAHSGAEQVLPERVARHLAGALRRRGVPFTATDETGRPVALAA
jgi:hypothetical protein